MRRIPLFTIIMMTVLMASAVAQAPPSTPPTRIRGTVEKFDDHTLTVKLRDGKSETLTLAPDYTVRTVIAETIADIKPGDKVGITSIKGSDGVRRAIEIHIFPPSMTTVRMGEFPWDLGTGSLMTNAPVAQVSAAPQGQIDQTHLERQGVGDHGPARDPGRRLRTRRDKPLEARCCRLCHCS